MFATGGRVVAACGVLDATFIPRGPGQIAVIDPADDHVISTFPLTTANPIGFLAAGLGGEALIGTVPKYGDPSVGCVERIQVAGTPASKGCLVSNMMLGGYVAHLGGTDPTGATAWAVVYGSAPAHAVPIALISGTPGTALTAPSGSAIADLATCPSGDLIGLIKPASGLGGFQRYQADGTARYTDPRPFGRAPAYTPSVVCD